jgi:predicted PurR-regulated permease PerM
MQSNDLAWFRRAAAATAGAVLILGIAWVALQASGVLLLVFLSILLASGLEPIVNRLRGRLPTGRLGTILLVYAVFLAIVVAVGVLLVPEALRQTQRIGERVPAVIEGARDWTATLQPAALGDIVRTVVDEVAGMASGGVQADPGTVVRASLTMVEAVAAVATVLTIVILWLTERVRLQRYVLAFLPAHRRAGAREAWNEIEAQLGMWVRGQLALMAAIGVTTGIAYTLLGLPAPLLLALIAAICEAIPIVGPALGAVPAVLVALTVSPQTALIVLVIYVIIQLVEGNVLVPLVMRNAVGMPPILVVTSLLVGGAVGGLAGALVAVPIAASVLVVLERLQARNVPVAPDAASASEAADAAGRPHGAHAA